MVAERYQAIGEGGNREFELRSRDARTVHVGAKGLHALQVLLHVLPG